MSLIRKIILIHSLLFFWVVSICSSAETEDARPKYYAEQQYDPISQKENQKPSTPTKVFDAIIVRPVMTAVTVISSAVFLGYLPFTTSGVAGIDTSTARDNLVVYPFNYTFKRPLGDFSESDEVVKPSRYALDQQD